jgi:hypothetical protein
MPGGSSADRLLTYIFTNSVKNFTLMIYTLYISLFIIFISPL